MSRRVTIVTAQLLGYDRAGGVGTATTFLALGLARSGHEVDVLYVGDAGAALDDEWSRTYEEAGTSVRPLTRDATTVSPAYFARMREVLRTLRAARPDVVIVHEYSAPAYAALRLRSLGLDFESTSFAVFCHGTRLWVKEMNRNELSLLERACVELADVVVSPSAYLLEWMRGQGWRLPGDSRVIPLLTRSGATGEPSPPQAAGGGAVERIVYFGRLEERKGIEPFAAGINAVAPELLGRVELEFVGSPTKYWSVERARRLLSDRARASLRGVSFLTSLDQHEALAHLSRPGTLAVIPSIAENSPNVVYECLERRIPFRASDVGGISELVAAGERPRVLFEPTADGIAAALGDALASPDALRPAEPAFDGDASRRAWEEVVSLQAPPTASAGTLPRIGEEWTLVLRDGDVADAELESTLARAQAASGADVVTCGVSADGSEHYFAGEPGGLGVLANGYGAAALVRTSLLDETGAAWPVAGDGEWPLLARLSARGAHIVSVPLPLVERMRPPGDVGRDPSDALLVVEEIERALPRQLRSAARLVAGLAADAERRAGS
jgi:glycosyltransferase involved in cell wall biosynthesis